MSTATSSRAPRARWLPSLVGLVLLGLVGTVVAVRATDEPAGSAPASPGPAFGPAQTWSAAGPAAPGSVPDDATLARSFAALDRAVETQDSAAFAAAAGSTSWASTTWRNLQALGVGDVDLRFVASRPGVAPGVVLASVEVAWTPGDDVAAYDGGTTKPREVTFAVTGAEDAAADDTVAVLSAGSTGDRWVPAWLTGSLRVDRLPGGAAVTVGAADATVGVDVDLLTRRAVDAVNAVLPGPGRRRQVVVVAPATAEQAVQLLGRSGDELDSVAAVTTTVDGSRRVDAPVQVVLNPVAFDRLGPRGAQVVVSHEAVHAATGAAAVPMPLWVAEGFADWVALHDGSVPLDVAAGQFLASVRRDGPPRSLPSQADFGTQAHGLGTTYEAAWTVFRLLEKRVGDQAVIAFYEDVLAGAPVAAALRDATGLDVAGLTRAWRTDVRRLARA